MPHNGTILDYDATRDHTIAAVSRLLAPEGLAINAEICPVETGDPLTIYTIREWPQPEETRADIEAREHAEREAEAWLAWQVAALEARFTSGGVYDVRVLPTGEEFLEVVCGHLFLTGELFCTCRDPLVAAQVFWDTLEREIVAGRTTGTLYWRVYPQLRGIKEDRTGVWRWNVRARLLILP